jgi:hypothetical protein
VPAWANTLSSLDLSDEEKGRAMALILAKPVEDRPLYFMGNNTSALAAVKKLLDQGARRAPIITTWYMQST